MQAKKKARNDLTGYGRKARDGERPFQYSTEYYDWRKALNTPAEHEARRRHAARFPMLALSDRSADRHTR